MRVENSLSWGGGSEVYHTRRGGHQGSRGGQNFAEKEKKVPARFSLGGKFFKFPGTQRGGMGGEGIMMGKKPLFGRNIQISQ